MITPLSLAEQLEPQVELTLQQRIADNQMYLDIIAHNISTQTVEIVSPHFIPHFSATQWFNWKVNGKDAELIWNAALIPDGTVTQRIPSGSEYLWTNILMRDIKVRTPDGYQSAFTLGGENTIEIFPSPRWGDIVVAPGTLQLLE